MEHKIRRTNREIKKEVNIADMSGDDNINSGRDLSVRMGTSKYCSEEHKIIFINDTPLDCILHNNYPEKGLMGLVPFITDWIFSEDEKNFVLGRYKSNEEKIMLPILMCPDDCDLWCTVIVAEVLRDGTNIIWNRIGINRSTREELIESYDYIGLRVEWLEKIPKMVFKEKEYNRELNKIYWK